MVSGIEPKLKHSVNALYQIWLLLCLATMLVFFLYFNRLTTATVMQATANGYRLYDRQCVELVAFRQTRAEAPFYYGLWGKGQQLLDRLHRRTTLPCSASPNSPM